MKLNINWKEMHKADFKQNIRKYSKMKEILSKIKNVKHYTHFHINSKENI